MKAFIQNYRDKLIEKLENIDIKSIMKIIKLLEKTEGRVYIIGNGGSAATASHMVNDLGAGLRRRGIRSFDVESLSDNTTVCTALANDIGYENIFYMQLKDRLQKDDILVAISCSGNSKNILRAVKYAKKIESKIVAITGFDGGVLKKRADVNFHVPSATDDYGLVEDMHMILNHIIYSYYIETQKGQGK